MTTAVHTNKARLEYSIAFIGYADLVGEVEAASHQDLAGDNYYQDLAEPEDWTGALRGIQHRRDAERRVVNLLANEIYRHLGCQNTAQYKARIRAVRRGTVDLYSDMGPCHSCRSVIKDFRWDFPTLAVDVRYRNALRGGGSAALIPAGEGLFGMYGIGDAVQRPDGQWVKSYPGAPVPAATATFDVKVAGPAGDRFRGTLDAVDQQPHAPYLYPAPNATAAPLDEATAVLDKIAQAIRNQMAPGQQMRPSPSGSGSAASTRAPSGWPASADRARRAARRSRRSSRTSRRSASRSSTRPRPRRRTARGTPTPPGSRTAPGRRSSPPAADHVAEPADDAAAEPAADLGTRPAG